jgi:hypothetical protein
VSISKKHMIGCLWWLNGDYSRHGTINCYRWCFCLFREFCYRFVKKNTTIDNIATLYRPHRKENACCILTQYLRIFLKWVVRSHHMVCKRQKFARILILINVNMVWKKEKLWISLFVILCAVLIIVLLTIRWTLLLAHTIW